MSEERPNEEVEMIGMLFRHPDHHPDLNPDGKYVLRQRGTERYMGANERIEETAVQARVFRGDYLNRTCWNWMSFNWEAIAF